MLKPFLPQLQTTFIKALNDPTRAVRMCAANALQKLIKLHTRVDPLFTELHNGVKNTEDNTIRYSTEHMFGPALYYVVFWFLQSCVQMTVDSNYVIANDALSDWVKNSASVLQPVRSKIKTNRTLYA